MDATGRAHSGSLPLPFFDTSRELVFNEDGMAIELLTADGQAKFKRGNDGGLQEREKKLLADSSSTDAEQRVLMFTYCIPQKRIAAQA